MTLEFDSEDIELEVPIEGLKIRGWEIRPLFRPQVSNGIHLFEIVNKAFFTYAY